MPTPSDAALLNVIRSLQASIDRLAGGARGAGIVDPGGAPVSASGGKGLSELLSDNNDALKALTEQLGKTQKDSRDSMLEHARRLEGLGAALAAAGPLLQQFAKYNITRPYEMIGGAAGQVARTALEREKDAGQSLTSMTALLALALGGVGAAPVAGAIAGLGSLGLNQVLGRYLFQDASIKTGALQTVGQMFGERVPGFRESAMQQYGLMKLDVLGLGAGIGAGRATGWARGPLAELGLGGPESTALIANAVQAGGIQGFRRLSQAGGAEAIRDIVNKGIYGTDPAQIAQAMAAGLRVGFTREMMEGASRRTGLSLAEMAQAGTMARMQTYLAGPTAGNMLFNMASNTQMARDVGMVATMGAITQAAGGAAGAAEGDEASAMLLYRQFREANPGATYLDFVEARRNKETDPRWLRMIGRGTATYAAGGQTGRILGAQLFGTRPMMLGGLATMMDQALGRGVGEISAEAGVAGLARGAVAMQRADIDQTLANATKMQATYGDVMEETAKKIEAASKASSDFNEYLKTMSEIMNGLSKSAVMEALRERYSKSDGPDITG